MLASQLAVHIRYLSALSLYLLLVCANPSVLLFLPLWGISSPRNPERGWQDTRVRLQYPLFNILTIQHDRYTQQSRPANSSDSSRSSISPPRNTSPEDWFVCPLEAAGLTGHTRSISPKVANCSKSITSLLVEALQKKPRNILRVGRLWQSS